MRSKKMYLSGSLAFAMLLVIRSTSAADVSAGKTLHDENCLKCHDTSVYTREKRQIISLDALRNRVTRCELSQGMNVTPAQTENIVQYLNQSFYHFE